MTPGCRICTAWLPLAALVASACLDSAGPEDLVQSFVVEPATVRAGDSFQAVLTVVNPTGKAVTVTAGQSCFAGVHVYRGGERLDFEGSTWGCFQVVRDFEVPPRDSLTFPYDLVAMIREDVAPWEYVVPPMPGTYQGRAPPRRSFLRWKLRSR